VINGVRRRPLGGSGSIHGQIPPDELLKMKKRGQKKSLTNSLFNLPDVLGMTGINDTT
jgi:hypothetical protein